MLTKIINCSVPDSKKDHFSYTQQHWSALAHVNGFIGQLGGWNIDRPNEACIIGVWDDHDSYTDFMKHTHDSLFYQSGQKQTYDSLQVSISEQSYLAPRVYRYFRSSAMETTYMVKTTLDLHSYEDDVITDLLKEVIHPDYRCLTNIVTRLDGNSVSIFTLYGVACPPKTNQSITHQHVRRAEQQHYRLEKKWLVLAHSGS
ncbi:YdbC family protein [Priestia koreensis]|uniref:YdbC family protein n=1 Tax=Priestia koreensis TaxID=284581 RepID=UPI001F581AA0|nr:YdbC family protein [Priestia koreensis]MCM3002982.1 YdbC family protein [Priestia koreensis]UNL85788.1 YdbC family protein [Priestia koreensis]